MNFWKPLAAPLMSMADSFCVVTVVNVRAFAIWKPLSSGTL